MPMLSTRVESFLKSHAVPFQVDPHDIEFRVKEGSRGDRSAHEGLVETRVLWIDGAFAMIVVPAGHEPDFKRFGRSLGVRLIKLASEYDLESLFPDCARDAIPPFGNLYDMPVYASDAVMRLPRIACYAGSRQETIRLDRTEWERLVAPTVLDFSAPA